MRDQQFANWLQGKIEDKPVSDYISRCKRVESSLNIDLDIEFRKDNGRSIIDQLTYTKEDKRNNVIPTCGIVFSVGADYYNGLSSLRSAIRSYVDFCLES